MLHLLNKRIKDAVEDYHGADDIKYDLSVRQCNLVFSGTLLYAPAAVRIAAKAHTILTQKMIENLSSTK